MKSFYLKSLVFIAGFGLALNVMAQENTLSAQDLMDGDSKDVNVNQSEPSSTRVQEKSNQVQTPTQKILILNNQPQTATVGQSSQTSQSTDSNQSSGQVNKPLTSSAAGIDSRTK